MHSLYRFQVSLLGGLLPFILLCLAANAVSPQQVKQPSINLQKIEPLINRYCMACHNPVANSGDVTINLRDLGPIKQSRILWHRVMVQMRDKAMPPKSFSQPSESDRQLLLDYSNQLASAPEPAGPPTTGKTLIRRLSRTEYNNTLRDLLGITTKPADSFPQDGGGGGGFDNNADTLFLPPILMERYLSAAGDALTSADPAKLFSLKSGKSTTDATTEIKSFASRAYRRPATTEELTRLVNLFNIECKRGGSYKDGLLLAYKATLVSPNFLFRTELNNSSQGIHSVTDYELASRLSYFLWATMPDAELMQLAAKNRLHNDEILKQQVDRMLSSPKSRDFAESFASQWLRIRDLNGVAAPDRSKFPTYSDTLKQAMYREPVELFQSMIATNAPLTDLLDCNYTILNEELAKHCGIGGVVGAEWRRVDLKDRRRGGVVTMPAVLTLTSYPRRTSPVLRGKWVLEEILGSPPPPPPPNAGGLSAEDTVQSGLTFRQRLEQHRKKPECAGCHAKMDPLGFGLENFDAIGRWRDDIAGVKVDCSGELTTGEKFAGPEELKKVLLQHKDEFLRNFTSKMLAYALGRGLESYDTPSINKIIDSVKSNNWSSRALLHGIVNSYPFLNRTYNIDESAH